MAQKKKKQSGQQFLSPEQYLKQKARSLEIGKCYISEGIEDCGEGVVFVTRLHTGGKVSVGFYLVDIYCLGVVDSGYRLRMEEEDVQEIAPEIGDPQLNKSAAVDEHAEIHHRPVIEEAVTKLFIYREKRLR